MRAALLVLPFLILTPSASAQSGPPRPVFSAGLDAVNVTVAVRDEKGRLVSDLGRDDFTVWEDGRRQQVQVFARAYEPGQDETLALDLGMLLDTSESMLKELRLSQEAAVRFLDAVPRARELVTVFFSDDIRVSRYDSESQQGLIERILDAKGGGNTALYDAIAVYLSRIQDSSGRKILVLFTDGDDVGSRTTVTDVMELVRMSSVTVYPIAFTGSLQPSRSLQPRAFLQALAEASGGRVFQPVSSRDLPDIYEKILDELRAQYVLGFTSDRAGGDGKFRKLKVDVKAKGLKARHRAGYYPLQPVASSE